MDQAQAHESAHAFHRWTSRTVLQQQSKIAALEAEPATPLDDRTTLHARFTAEGTEGTEPWPNFQLDGYGFWLSSLAHHVSHTPSDPGEFLEAVELITRYLMLLWDRPCFDCWEEFPNHRHPTTIAAVAAGLRNAAALLHDSGPAQQADHIIKWLMENGLVDDCLAKFEAGKAVDGSALLVFGPLGPFSSSDPVAVRTVERIELELVKETGGVHRYLGDEYYGGGLWLPLSGALAWIHAEWGNRSKAAQILHWMEGAADLDGSLPEQVSRNLMVPGQFQYWTDLWGPVAKPLLWSHAMYLIARIRLER